MKKLFAVMAAIALLGSSMAASAEIIIDTVTVGDPGNTADTTGYGSVSYVYKIGKYEVTAGQYCAFLNAVAKTDTYGLYNDANMAKTGLGSGIIRSGSSGSYIYTVDAAFVNRPVNWVSFWDACRFANWLHNGQPTGDQDLTTTEDGAYFLNGYTGRDGRKIQRKPGWKWAVPTEDEWYKAAYYKGGGTNAGYWLYPTQRNTEPSNNLNDVNGNGANYYRPGSPYPIDNGKYTTVVGEFENSDSAYGTFDQAGNVIEWTETIIYHYQDPYRCVRGGGFASMYFQVGSTFRFSCDAEFENAGYGFRVCQAVPESSSIVALLGGLAGLVRLRKRKA